MLTTQHGYFPITTPYKIGPDLRKLPRDFDFFHYDEHWCEYLDNKRRCRDKFNNYYNVDNFST